MVHAVSCLLGCLPELSNDGNQLSQPSYGLLCHNYCNYWPIFTLLNSLQHKGIPVFIALSLV